MEDDLKLLLIDHAIVIALDDDDIAMYSIEINDGEGYEQTFKGNDLALMISDIKDKLLNDPPICPLKKPEGWPHKFHKLGPH